MSTHLSGYPTNQELGSLNFSEVDFWTGTVSERPATQAEGALAISFRR
jgi:hypothetical protein